MDLGEQINMKRDNEPHKKKFKMDVAGIGSEDIDLEKLEQEAVEDLHQPISLTPLKEIPPTLRVYSKKQKKIIPRRGIVYAAAGPEAVSQTKLSVMSDPLKTETRKDLSACAISEPNLSTAIDRGTESLFKNGFNLELELASKYNQETGAEFSPEEIQSQLTESSQSFLPLLAKLKTWKDDKNIVELMRDAGAVSFVQGKNATMYLPGILDLKTGALPVLAETIYADDLKEVIVDTGLTRKIVAVKTNLKGKKICRADEMVYLVRGAKKALRRDGKFYGLPAIEPILIIAKILKRIYNYDSSEAVIASYVTKMMFEVDVDGNGEGLKERIEKLLAEFAKRGKHAFATFDEIKKVTPVGVKVDWSMLDGVESKLAHLVLSAAAIPSSMANREQNLNRDLATIQAIQFIEFFRSPLEELIGNAFADQMFTPLLAHLAGINVAQMPVRVKVVRVKPEKDMDQIWGDSLAEKKQDEINMVDESNIRTPIGTPEQQTSTTGIFQAAGPEGIKVTPDSKGGYIVKRNS